MTLVETQHRLALEQLRRAGEQPVSLAALRAAGLDSPAAVISELELNGYAIERVYEHGRLVGLRLIEREDADTGATRRRHWWSRAASIGWLRSSSPWLLRHPPQPPRRGHADPRKSFASR